MSFLGRKNGKKKNGVKMNGKAIAVSADDCIRAALKCGDEELEEKYRVISSARRVVELVDAHDDPPSSEDRKKV